MQSFAKQIRFALEMREEQSQVNAGQNQGNQEQDQGEKIDYEEKYKQLREQYIEALDVIEEYESEISQYIKELPMPRVSQTYSQRVSLKMKELEQSKANYQNIFEQEKEHYEVQIHNLAFTEKELKRNLEKKEVELQNLQKEIKEKTKDNEEMFEKLKKNEAKLDQVKQDKLDVELFNEKMQKENTSLRKKIEKYGLMKKEREDLRKENSKLKTQIQQLKEDKDFQVQEKKKIQLLNQVIVKGEDSGSEECLQEIENLDNQFQKRQKEGETQ